MSVYFAPEWGAQLGNALKGIGTGLRDLVNPNFEVQQKLQQALLDPTQATNIANAASLNPQLYGVNNPVVGKRNAAMIQSLQASPDFAAKMQTANAARDRMNQSSREREGAADKAYGTGTQQGERREDQIIQAADLNIQENIRMRDALAQFRQKYPQLSEEEAWRAVTGTNSINYQSAQREWQLIEEGSKLDPAKARELIQNIATGKDTTGESFRQLEALRLARPTAFKVIDDQLDFEQRAALSLAEHTRSLSRQRGLDNEQRIFNAQLATAQSMANQFEIPLEVAVARLGYKGPEFDAMSATVTPEQLAHAETQIKAVDQSRQNRTRLEQNRIVTTLNNDLRRGLDQFNEDKKWNRPLNTSIIQQTLFDLGEVTGRGPISVRLDGRKLRYYDQKGVELKESDLLKPEYFTTSGITTTPPGTDSEETPAERLKRLEEERNRRQNRQ